MIENDIFLKCDCHGEAMQVSYDDEFKQYWFAYWGYGFTNKKTSLWCRIKYAFMLITKGTLYKDFLILDKDRAQQLANYIKLNNEN